MISKFVIVGCLGFVLQLLTLWALSSLAGWPWLPATAAAVEMAVLHNFVWHERWTWADRRFGGFGGFGRLVRFNVATGLISIVGNVALMDILVEALGLPPIRKKTIFRLANKFSIEPDFIRRTYSTKVQSDVHALPICRNGY